MPFQRDGALIHLPNELPAGDFYGYAAGASPDTGFACFASSFWSHSYPINQAGEARKQEIADYLHSAATAPFYIQEFSRNERHNGRWTPQETLHIFFLDHEDHQRCAAFLKKAGLEENETDLCDNLEMLQSRAAARFKHQNQILRALTAAIIEITRTGAPLDADRVQMLTRRIVAAHREGTPRMAAE